jgi:hypothetical protein
MTEQNNAKDPLNWVRVVLSFLYLLVALSLIFLFRKDIFYFNEEEGSWNFYRFIWCLSVAFIGFFCVAFSLRRHKPSPFPKYVTLYPVQLGAVAALVFGGLHISDVTGGYLFYYLSFGLCFTLGYLVDSYWSFTKGIVERLGKK